MVGIGSRIGNGNSERPVLVIEELAGGSGVVAFMVTGQLDVSTEGELRSVLQEAVMDEPTKIVLDVSGLSFMDSSGLAVLLVAARQVEVVELRNPTSIIRRLINVTGLTQTLRMTSDE